MEQEYQQCRCARCGMIIYTKTEDPYVPVIEVICGNCYND